MACFTVADAGQLMLKLQALDETLRLTPLEDHPKLNLESKVVVSGVYVNGSEDLFRVVKGIPCPDLIPDVYIEAYRTVLQRRPYSNQPRVSDKNKGEDLTFSKVRCVLPKIDALCGTELYGYIQKLEQNVQPFPFLRLPAELRLQVYSYILPREAHIALLYSPHCNHQLPRLSLDILRVNRQLHDECVKYFYENRTLWMIAARDTETIDLSNEFVARYYETLAVMNTQTRLLFKKLEIHVGALSIQLFMLRRYHEIPSVSDHMSQIFAMLPNLETVLFSFQPIRRSRFGRAQALNYSKRDETMLWLLDCMPQPAPRIQWDFSPSSPFLCSSHEQGMRPKLEELAGMEMGESILSRLECFQQQRERPNSP